MKISLIAIDDQHEPEERVRLRRLLGLHDKLIGVVHLVPSHFSSSRGSLNCPVIDPVTGNVVGEFFARFLVITPFENPHNSLHKVWRTSPEWVSQYTQNGKCDQTNPRGLAIGHRGVGRSFKQVEGFRKAAIRVILSLSSFLFTFLLFFPTIYIFYIIKSHKLLNPYSSLHPSFSSI